MKTTIRRPARYAPRHQCPRCRRRHRDWYAVASCRWKGALWITGRPTSTRDAYAVVSHCRGLVTVTLWKTLEQAQEAKAMIDACACGGCCCRHHELVVMTANPSEESPP